METGFQVSHKGLLRAAGIRIKPMPHSRKLRLKIKRHSVRAFFKGIYKFSEENTLVEIESCVDPITKISMQTSIFRENSTGKLDHRVELVFGIALEGPNHSLRLSV